MRNIDDEVRKFWNRVAADWEIQVGDDNVLTHRGDILIQNLSGFLTLPPPLRGILLSVALN